MPDWSPAIEAHIANKPTRERFPNPVDFDRAMAEYAETPGRAEAAG